MAARHCALLILWENKTTSNMLKTARRNVKCRESWIFQLLRQCNASCRILIVVLSGYHIRKNCPAPQRYFFTVNTALKM